MKRLKNIGLSILAVYLLGAAVTSVVLNKDDIARVLHGEAPQKAHVDGMRAAEDAVAVSTWPLAFIWPLVNWVTGTELYVKIARRMSHYNHRYPY